MHLATLATATLLLLAAASAASAQPPHEHHPGMTHPADSTPAQRRATLPGQDAFGAISEVVQILRTTPGTDWNKVDLEALRQHLIDMNAVTLGASVASTPVAGGIRLTITGSGRTREAVRRMVTAHATALAQERLRGVVTPHPEGVTWTVTTNDPKRVAELRALGFIGILALGDHHTSHHLQLAKGDTPAGHGH